MIKTMFKTMIRKPVHRLIAIGIAFVVLALIVVGGMGWAVLHLWNWLMPEVFGLRAVSFWQAVGLMALSWILFGGPGWMGPRSPRRYAYSRGDWQRWQQMTPEQRAAFREGLRGQWGDRHTPESEAKEGGI